MGKGEEGTQVPFVALCIVSVAVDGELRGEEATCALRELLRALGGFLGELLRFLRVALRGHERFPGIHSRFRTAYSTSTRVRAGELGLRVSDHISSLILAYLICVTFPFDFWYRLCGGIRSDCSNYGPSTENVIS